MWGYPEIVRENTSNDNWYTFFVIISLSFRTIPSGEIEENDDFVVDKKQF